MSYTVDKLIEFEEEVAELFNSGSIRAPIHLSLGNERILIDLFKEVRGEDWVFSSWRSHYHCLLKGVPPELLLSKIKEGKSISLAFPEFRVFTSAIAGGQLPHAVGVALSLKRRKQSGHVWCFVGDMVSETGMFQTCATYSLNFQLPITFIVEDNGLSVMTDTRGAWGAKVLRYETHNMSNVLGYKYKNTKYPHSGAGIRVQF